MFDQCKRTVQSITYSAVVEEGEIRFDTYFIVQDFYKFDVVRQAQNKIDPTKYDISDVSIDITLHTAADTITINEYVPVNFTVNTDASVVEAAVLKILRWQRSLSDNKTSANYSHIPYLLCGPNCIGSARVKINYGSITFTEARPCWVAVDPDGSNCTECHDTSNTSIDYTNYSLSIHRKISTNDNSTNPNEGCWACHGANSTGDHN